MTISYIPQGGEEGAVGAETAAGRVGLRQSTLTELLLMQCKKLQAQLILAQNQC